MTRIPANKRISVIIVTYNAAPLIQRCLDSIYIQEYTNIEIIVIDGKSTDGTITILENNSSKIHFWLSEKDERIYDAMNKALKYVTGNWVYFLGADDELLPEFSVLINALTAPDTIYYANVLTNGIKRSGFVSPYYMAKVGVYHQAIIYPKSVFDNYTYNTNYKINADYALNMLLFKDKRYHFKYIDLIIARYNHTGVSATIIDHAFQADKSKLIRQNFGAKLWLRYQFRLLKSRFKIK